MIKPQLKEFELELKEYPERKAIHPLKKRMNGKAIKFYNVKRETKCTKASPRDFGFGSFPNFDSNIRSGFGSFGNGFESEKPFPKLPKPLLILLSKFGKLPKPKSLGLAFVHFVSRFTL